MSDFTLTATLRDVVVPYLREVGERWANGELTIIQEHFASNVIRGRLGGLARGWGNGEGPRAVLACPPGELHDLPLLIFGIILNRRGWRVDYFGANTPVVEVIDGARRSPPDLIVMAATAPERLTAIGADLAIWPRGTPRPRRSRRITRHGRAGRRRVAHRRPSHSGRAATAPTEAVSHGSRDAAEATGPLVFSVAARAIVGAGCRRRQEACFGTRIRPPLSVSIVGQTAGFPIAINGRCVVARPGDSASRTVARLPTWLAFRVLGAARVAVNTKKAVGDTGVVL